jgi:hypothetical protein
VACQKLEMWTVQKFESLLNMKQHAKLRPAMAEDLVLAFERIVKKHSLKATLSRFFLCLFVSFFRNLDKELYDQVILAICWENLLDFSLNLSKKYENHHGQT